MAGTIIPAVPLRTPMHEVRDPGNTPPLSRTWIIFFEQLIGALEGVGKDLAPTFHRTLLVYDSTVGNDIAPRLTTYAAGSPLRVVGVLRKAITADLTIRINLAGSVLITCTIPLATAVSVPLTFSAFTHGRAITDGQVLTWDIVASDGATNAAGIAAFTLQWNQ